MKHIPSYIKIFNVMGNGAWHNKSDFCRAYSQDDRRLREMKERGWVDYEERVIRQNGIVLYSQYRITKVYPSWWEYSKQFNLFKVDSMGQLEMAV